MSYVTSDPTKLENIEFRGGQYISLDPHYRKHVKPKKQHEIDQMSKVGKFLSAMNIYSYLSLEQRLFNEDYFIVIIDI